MSIHFARAGIDATVRRERVPMVDIAPRVLASWLLNGGVQLTRGPHAGGVVGSVYADGRPAYVYPEITGYYMQWLSWLAAGNGVTPALTHRAAMAQRWLAAWIQDTDLPLTRVYLHANDHDWRNQALFFFDLAMVLRGVASATRASLIDPDGTLVRNVVAHLSLLIDSDGMFCPYRVGSALPKLPDRWSTLRGGFQAKAAAGVLNAGSVLALVDDRLIDAATATMTASLDAAIGCPHDETHPALYAIEGALSATNRRAVARLLPALTNQIDMLLTHASIDGWLPESMEKAGVERLDIIAQALRAAVLLRARCVDWSPDPQAMEKMRQLLASHIDATGAVPFSPRAAPPQHNVWCAMFAEQALQISQPGVSHSQLFDLETYLV